VLAAGRQPCRADQPAIGVRLLPTRLQRARLTLIASARLHKLDPEVYLRDVFRVLPRWPRDRYLELAPRYWRITRARLDREELDREVGWLTVPELRLPTMLPSDALVTPPSSAP
jgi:hypothetical protein